MICFRYCLIALRIKEPTLLSCKFVSGSILLLKEAKIETENKKQSNDAGGVIEKYILDTKIVEPAQKTIRLTSSKTGRHWMSWSWGDVEYCIRGFA